MFAVLLLLLFLSGSSPHPPAPASRRPHLWGFADLHAHPAAHLAFGADARGENGIVWGKPGMALETARSTLATDMPPCYPETHNGFDLDPIREGTRAQLLRSLDSSTGWTHAASGAPAFRSWPHAQSLDHQQMHLLAVRRAYEGGLRLMIATAVDNQLLSTLWTKIGFNLSGNQMPPPSRTFDYDSARKQIDFIRQLAAQNSSWLRVVTTAAEARETILGNQLAVILGIEMDTLSAGQIVDLVKNHQVRHIIPIHLVDNNFGGTALAGDLFNTSNEYLTGSFYKVACDPALQFRLGRPSVLRPSGTLRMPGAMLVKPLDDDAFRKLGYAKCTGGQKNAKGLAEDAYTSLFRQLMQAGVLIDVAHMSELAMESAIRLAEVNRYPLMDSHTGLWQPCALPGGECGNSERDLKRAHARRVAALGGVIGLGTSAPPAGRAIFSASGNPRLMRFTRASQEWARTVSFTGPRADQAISRLWITFMTGEEALDGGDRVDAVIQLRDSRQLTFRNVSQGQRWQTNSTHTVELPLSYAIRMDDIRSLRIQVHMGGLWGGAWSIHGVALDAHERELDPVGQWLKDYQDALSVMGGRGVALGTDMNGFSPQIPFAAVAPRYPVTVASRFGSPPPAFPPPPLAKFQLGSRVYELQKDGLAHYGMLPDFLQAVSELREMEPERALDAVYRSAGDVVEMWEKAEAAGRWSASHVAREP